MTMRIPLDLLAMPFQRKHTAPRMLMLVASTRMPAPPLHELYMAERTIRHAARLPLHKAASTSLHAAQRLLHAAHEAVGRSDMAQARSLAEQAWRGADVLMAEAEAQRAGQPPIEGAETARLQYRRLKAVTVQASAHLIAKESGSAMR